ncbi:MAG: Lipocalin family protein [Chitinophagaceae bacterium]|nr:Lipocalin family protein [Chitinophagaceae bacterium]
MKKVIVILLFFTHALMSNAQMNKPVAQVDLKKMEGKWYSLSSIPTALDKKWRETDETYTWNEKGYFDVYTTYKKVKKDKSKKGNLRSKLFQVEGTGNAEMKAQFVWPFKIDYWVVELAEDYSYMIVGHPKKKYLFIMCRKPSMDKVLYMQIVERCKNRGYQTDELVFQFDF